MQNGSESQNNPRNGRIANIFLNWKHTDLQDLSQIERTSKKQSRKPSNYYLTTKLKKSL